MVESVFGAWFMVIIASGGWDNGRAIGTLRMENEGNCKIQAEIIMKATNNETRVFCIRGVPK